MFDPNEHLIPLKGKNYLQVQWRLVWFRDEKPNWCIDTTMLSADDNEAIFNCKIYDENGNIKASAHGSETKKDFNDFKEKAETKAVGRALAYLGYGTQFTADELDEGERIVDSPVEKKKAPAKAEPKAEPKAEEPTIYRCANCGNVLKPYTNNGKQISVNDHAAKSEKKFGKILCLDCIQKQ